MPLLTCQDGEVQTKERAELTAILRALETIDISDGPQVRRSEAEEPLATLVVANAGLTPPRGRSRPRRNEVAVSRRICLKLLDR